MPIASSETVRRRGRASRSPTKAGRGKAGLRSFKAPSSRREGLEAESRRELDAPGRASRHRLPEERRALVADDCRRAEGVERVEDAETAGEGGSLLTLGPVEVHVSG